MSTRMLKALQEAQKCPLRRVHDQTHGQAPWPAHPSSLASLVKQGLLEKPRRRISRNGHAIDEWFVTAAGLEALKPKAVVKRDPVQLMRVPGGSTRMMQLGVWVDVAAPEPEKVKAEDLDAGWFGRAAERQAAARDRGEAARQIGRLRRVA